MQQLRVYHETELAAETQRYAQHLKAIEGDQHQLGKLVARINLLEFALRNQNLSSPAERTPYVEALEKNLESSKNSIAFLGNALDQLSKTNLEHERKLMELQGSVGSPDEGDVRPVFEHTGFQGEIEKLLESESFLHLAEELKSGKRIMALHARASDLQPREDKREKQSEAEEQSAIDHELQRLKSEIVLHQERSHPDHSESEPESDDDDEDDVPRGEVDLETVFADSQTRKAGESKVSAILISADVPKKSSWSGWFS